MTREEVKGMLMRMAVDFPTWKCDDLTLAINSWADYLKDYPKESVAIAYKQYVFSNTTGFAPSVGQIVSLIPVESELNETAAWALVSKALRNGTYGAEQEFAKLPETVQKAVGSPANLRNWAQTDIDSVENVIQSNFMRVYRTEVKRAEELKKLPVNLRTLIESVTKERKMISGKVQTMD